MSGNVFICPPAPVKHLPLSTRLAVGFGSVEIRKGTMLVWEGDDEGVTLEGFDNAASVLTEDGIPWRVVFNGPMSRDTFKRNTHGIWELEAQEDGFA